MFEQLFQQLLLTFQPRLILNFNENWYLSSARKRISNLDTQIVILLQITQFRTREIIRFLQEVISSRFGSLGPGFITKS